MKLSLLPSTFSLLSLASAQSLVEVLSSRPQLSSLLAALQEFPDLVDAVSQTSNITVLAPANFALAAFLETDEGARFSADPEYARAFLSYHVLQGTYNSTYFNGVQPSTRGAEFFPTLLQPGPYCNVTGGQTVEATAGTFRVEDTTNVTFFSGFVLDSNWADDSLLDLEFDGGLIHGINPPLTLPPNVSTNLVAAQRESLLGAIQRVGLLESLESSKDLLLFAPTNQGFQNIGSEIDNLSDDDLREILLYHVAITNGTLYGIGLTDGLRLQTLNGNELTITVQNGPGFENVGIVSEDFFVFVNGVRIINFNLPIENGVVFGVDNILNPFNTTARPPASATAGQRQFGEARAGTVFPYTEGIRTTDSPIFSATNVAGTTPPPNTPTPLIETMTGTGLVGTGFGNGTRPNITAAATPAQYTGGVPPMITKAPMLGAIAAGALFAGL
ncbi:hypothetical protein CBER1_08910 [Cercospora berteroae]|uniref:FAS1 domain-containing protein n=1 Tax=Cercospora berteroae TaxID=357750 RepID=A0A2S6BW44_9PEZI|nr:hypothetical protein CBER1_08910 [Cercospora berteroae]